MAPVKFVALVLVGAAWAASAAAEPAPDGAPSAAASAPAPQPGRHGSAATQPATHVTATPTTAATTQPASLADTSPTAPATMPAVTSAPAIRRRGPGADRGLTLDQLIIGIIVVAAVPALAAVLIRFGRARIKRM